MLFTILVLFATTNGGRAWLRSHSLLRIRWWQFAAAGALMICIYPVRTRPFSFVNNVAML